MTIIAMGDVEPVQWKRHVNTSARIMVFASTTQTILPVLSLIDMKQKVHDSLLTDSVMLANKNICKNERVVYCLPSWKMFMKCCSMPNVPSDLELDFFLSL